VARAAGYTYKLCPGKGGKEPVGCGIGLLLVVVDPELVLGTDKLVRREFPYRNRAGNGKCSGADRRKEMPLDLREETGPEGDKAPALFPGQGIKGKKGGVFTRYGRIVFTGRCWRTILLLLVDDETLPGPAGGILARADFMSSPLFFLIQLIG